MEMRLHNFSTGADYFVDMRRIACLVLLTFSLLLPESASCHLLPEKTGTIHVVGNAAFVAVSIPLAMFGHVQTQEEMQQQFNMHFQVRDKLLGGQPVLTMIMMPQNAPSNYVVVLHRVNFGGPPRNLSLFTDFFRNSHEDKMLTLKVSRDKEVQMLVLTGGTERFALLPGKMQLLFTFIGTGINHILTGPDHLLFLLTILIGAAGWRYWAGAVSAFTVAHSITLTLSALGYVHIPSFIIEPGIAASIVLMALDNLFRPNARKLNRVGLIFLCGLLHGLGFASSIADMGLDTTHRILSLLGFNLGIETGQFLFLGSLAASFFLVKRFLPTAGSLVQAPRLASATACVLGLIMFVQRVAL
jgi:hydrogenase/urease accessory protein HupE